MASSSAFLNVQDIEKSLKFYRGLGFSADHVTKGDDGVTNYVDLSFDGAELGLGRIGMNDDKDFRAWVGTPLGAGVVIYFTVGNVDKIYANAQKVGATIEYAPTDRSYGRVFGLNDPDGYVLSFLAEKRAAKKAPARKAAKKAAPRKAPAKKPAKASKKAAKKSAKRR